MEINQIQIESREKGDKMLEESLKIDFEKESNEDFLKLQQEDGSLSQYWKDVKRKRKEETKFFVNSNNGLLYRKTIISGIQVNQIVLPKNKRQMVSETAHNSIWSLHLARDKTVKRILLYF